MGLSSNQHSFFTQSPSTNTGSVFIFLTFIKVVFYLKEVEAPNKTSYKISQTLSILTKTQFLICKASGLNCCYCCTLIIHLPSSLCISTFMHCSPLLCGENFLASYENQTLHLYTTVCTWYRLFI